MNSFLWARSCGLEKEWFESFLQDYESTIDVSSAVSFANREWDL